jgi:hypothetical protein
MSAQHQRSNECRRFVFVIEAIRVYARHRRSAVPCSNQTRSRHESLQDAALWSASPRPLMPTYSPNSFGYAAVASASYHNSGEENVSMSIPERESPYRRAQETCRAKVSADPVISALLSILGAERNAMSLVMGVRPTCLHMSVLIGVWLSLRKSRRGGRRYLCIPRASCDDLRDEGSCDKADRCTVQGGASIA